MVESEFESVNRRLLLHKKDVFEIGAMLFILSIDSIPFMQLQVRKEFKGRRKKPSML